MDTGNHRVAFCPHCGNTAPQRIVFSHTYQTEWFGADGKKNQDPGPDCEAILCICETCDDVLLYDGVSAHETGNWPELVHPKSPQLPASVPNAIREVYAEASRIKRIASNAYAVMIRRAIEEICNERGIKKGSLAKRLDDMATRGDIPPTLAEVTAMLRVLGNAGAHSTNTPVTQPMTWAMDEFFRVVVEYVYVAPSKLSEFKKKLSSADIK